MHSLFMFLTLYTGSPLKTEFYWYFPWVFIARIPLLLLLVQWPLFPPFSLTGNTTVKSLSSSLRLTDCVKVTSALLKAQIPIHKVGNTVISCYENGHEVHKQGVSPFWALVGRRRLCWGLRRCSSVREHCGVSSSITPLPSLWQPKTSVHTAKGTAEGKTGRMMLPALFFFFKTALAIWGLSWFHTNFRIICAISMKKMPHWNFGQDIHSVDCFE